MKELEKKEAELMERFESKKREAVKEEAIVNEHSARLRSLMDELKDLQAQYRLIQELKAGKNKK